MKLHRGVSWSRGHMADLSERHRSMLRETSGLTDEVIDGRGYRTISKVEFHKMVAVDEKERPFHTYLLKAEGWMGIPVVRPDGKIHCEIIRVDGQVKSRNGFQRYVWPMNGVRNAIDVHPQAVQYVADPRTPLVITEGIKKADSIFRFSTPSNPLCVLGQNGCWGWRSNPKGASVACPDWYDIALEDREIYIVVDSDYLINDNVKAGWDACAYYLRSKVQHDNRVRIVIVPPNGRQKQGADDYLLYHDLDDLLSLAISPSQVVSNGTSHLEVLNGMKLIDEADDEVKWLVRRAVATESITVMAGHTQTYKTWHALELSLSLALGKAWLNHPDMTIEESGGGIYVNKEMRGKLGTRVKAMVYHESFHDQLDLRTHLTEKFWVVEQADFDMKSETGVEAVIEAAKDFGAKLLIFDSLSMVWSGDENSNTEVGGLFHKLRRIIEATGCSIILLHHLVKPSKERAGFNPIFHMRGAGQLGQQADAVFIFSVEREDEDGKIIRITNAKARDDRELPAFYTKFLLGEGTTRQLRYEGEVITKLAQEAHDNPSQIQIFEDFIFQVLIDKTDMKNRPLTPAEVKAVISANWSTVWGGTPGEKKVQRALKSLQDRQMLILDGNQRRGFHYSINLVEEQIETQPIEEKKSEEKESVDSNDEV